MYINIICVYTWIGGCIAFKSPASVSGRNVFWSPEMVFWRPEVILWPNYCVSGHRNHGLGAGNHVWAPKPL